MPFFVIVVNDWKSLIIVTENSVLYVEGFLDPFLLDAQNISRGLNFEDKGKTQISRRQNFADLLKI